MHCDDLVLQEVFNLSISWRSKGLFGILQTMNGKMKNPTSLSLTEKPQNKHDALGGIQNDNNNNLATEVAEPVRCVKYLQKKLYKKI